MDDIKQVKRFLESTAETGSYDGRDTEGFVIRCQSKAGTNAWHDWFFKYKFEEPYLMYRQWRECTKAIIAGKPPKYKKHKKVTEEYLEFARRQLHGNPGLRDAYQHNHGIIKLRDDFLAFRGVKGSDIIRQEALEGDGGNEDVVKDVMLVAVASIGCGKTTVALALCNLFKWGHVQNDNITARKGKPAVFAQECCMKLADANAMVADRNNHQRRERKQLIEDVTRIVPGTRFVALHYVHDRRAYDKIRRQTRDRVLSRGDNHQTIQAGTKGPGEIIGIMEGFLDRFEPVNDDELPDSDFDIVIDLDVCASSRGNLETVVNRMYAEYPKLFRNNPKPSADDMDDAIHTALNDYQPDIKHEIKGGGGKQKNKGQANSAKKQRERKLEYFAVQLPATRVTRLLENIFKDEGPESVKMYDALKLDRRVQTEFHVTLIHRSASGDPYWATLADMYNKAKEEQSNLEPKLGLCTVRIERLVWDGRVMAFVARLSSPGDEDWHTTNKVAHSTVGTAAAAIKPVESNALLERWLEVGSGGNTGIRDLMVDGVVELEGVVRGVLQQRG
ncbi:hypothetical protein K431DRAFT_283608 [Polychaeton citri CBS 116435]|uniref:tRNA ligase n=1 Tax=Polychaeton citri CBS 116435 TaxID=1314669 RepID=A0A9P4URG6_9PEZI|nr:hypothetical protein K431DRAFT_283608 [Polychaeton citri CBS 116435]